MVVSDASCITNVAVDSGTKDTLIYLIREYGGWDSNDIYTDVHLEWIGEYDGFCDVSNPKTIGVKVLVDNVCYQHILPDGGSVYDFTYWTLPQTHPGNAIAEAAGHPHPIKKWAENDSFELLFPNWHPIDRWENNKEYFDYVGRSFDDVSYLDLPTKLRTKDVADAFGASSGSLEAVVVCGSPGEISNDSSFQNVFAFANSKYCCRLLRCLIQRSPVRIFRRLIFIDTIS